MAKRGKLTDQQQLRLLKVLERDERRERRWARLKTLVSVLFGGAWVRLKIWAVALLVYAPGLLALYDLYLTWHGTSGGGSGR